MLANPRNLKKAGSVRIPSTTLRKGMVDKGVGVLSWILQERGGENTYTLVPQLPIPYPASAGAALQHRTQGEQRQAAPEKDF